MSALTHDAATTRTAPGLLLGLTAAATFAASGPLAKGLIAAGWTPGSAVTARVLIAAAVLVVPAAMTLRGRWHLLRAQAGLVIAYGLIAVAACQLSYFNAVDRMQVGVALLIEFTAPVAVVGWMWLRHGQRPGRLTVAGALAALVGLALVLDLVSGAELDGIGVLWALGAMVCAAFYWIVSADDQNGLPGIVLAAGGLLLGGVTLLAAGAIGVVPFAASRADVILDGRAVAWWVTLLVLGVVTAAVPYVLGIAGSRLMGSRLASFVGLAEAVAGVVFAWLLLDEAPRAIQLLGGVCILAGVVLVRLGEPKVAEAPPEGVTP
ncbi:EamA family transporter [Aeromicrobium wangtongii]|uniref:EamA family transporter n=1 Tax=Aeromicrobium wangtongii TaxID=2969247 RepID=UPI002017789A|nr:DMT family transporter [Aeromicrobium wangtongii]MCL3817425.1 DMT family transporter [Aeromicrobium wangtongii]